MEDFILAIGKTIWLFLPAGVANMCPVVFRCIPWGSQPIDFGFRFRGQALFGAHKTIRGCVVGILGAVVTLFAQQWLYPYTTSIALLDYSSVNAIFLGILLGVGALGGDLVKSFFKRRIGIPSGAMWIPFDQLDWIIGTILVLSFFIVLPWFTVIIALVLGGILHPAINLMGYYLRLKKNMF